MYVKSWAELYHPGLLTYIYEITNGTGIASAKEKNSQKVYTLIKTISARALENIDT